MSDEKIKAKLRFYRTCFKCHKKVKMEVEKRGDIVKIYCPICDTTDEMIFLGGNKNGKND